MSYRNIIQPYEIIDLSQAFAGQPIIIQDHKTNYSKARMLGNNFWSAICISLIEWSLENENTNYIKHLNSQTNNYDNTLSSEQEFLVFKNVVQTLLDKPDVKEFFTNIINEDSEAYTGAHIFLQLYLKTQFGTNPMKQDIDDSIIHKLQDVFKMQIIVHSINRNKIVINCQESLGKLCLVQNSQQIWFYMIENSEKQSIEINSTKKSGSNSPTKRILNILSEVYKDKKCQICNQSEEKLLNPFPCKHCICMKCLDVLNTYQDAKYCTVCNLMEDKITKICANCDKEILNEPLYQPSNSQCQDYFCQACIQQIRMTRNHTKCDKCHEDIMKHNFQHVKERQEYTLQIMKCPQCKKDVQALIDYSCQHQQCEECHNLYGKKCNHISCNRDKSQSHNNNWNQNSGQNIRDSNASTTTIDSQTRVEFCSKCKKFQSDFLIFKNPDCFHKWCFDCIPKRINQSEKARFCLLSGCKKLIDESQMTNFYNQCLTKQLPYQQQKSKIFLSPKSQQNIQLFQSKQKLSQLKSNEVSPMKKDRMSRMTSPFNESLCQICLEYQPNTLIFNNTNCSHRWCFNCINRRSDYLNDYKCYFYDNCRRSLNESDLSQFYEQCKKNQQIFQQQESDQQLQKLQFTIKQVQCDICKQKQSLKKIFNNQSCEHKWCFDCIAAMGDQMTYNECYIWKCRWSLNNTEMNKFYDKVCEDIRDTEKIDKIYSPRNSDKSKMLFNLKLDSEDKEFIVDQNYPSYNIIILHNQEEQEFTLKMKTLQYYKIKDIIEYTLTSNNLIMRKPQMFVMLGRVQKQALQLQTDFMDVLLTYPEKQNFLIQEEIF